MAIAAVSISPIGEGTSVSRFVAAALDVVQSQERIRFRLDPMFTTLEGDLSEIYALVSDMQEAVFAAGAERVSTVIKKGVFEQIETKTGLETTCSRRR